MKLLCKTILMLVAWTAIALTSCSKSENSTDEPDPASQNKARYSVLVYGNAGGKMDDIMEYAWEKCLPLMKDGSVRVAFFYKYGKEFTEKKDENGNIVKERTFTGKYAQPGDVVFFELTKDTDLKQISKDAVGLEDFELYDPESLAYAINTVKEDMPAENYVLLLYGHGGGFDENIDYPKDWRKKETPQSRRGILYDEWIPTIAGQEAMDVYEFCEGIESSEIPHFKAIFFHNCLMGNMEILDEIYDTADYLITTMHALASDGSYIVEMIQGLYDNADFEKATKQMFERVKPGLPRTYTLKDGTKLNGDLNLIKTSEFDKLNPVFAKLCKRLIELYPTQKEALDKAAAKTYRATLTYPFYDALDYANKVAEATNDAQLKDIAAELKTALNAVLIERMGVHQNEEAPMKEYTLSVVITDKTNFAAKTAWDYTISKAYEFTDFSMITGWCEWLKTNTHNPTGNPVGQAL